MEENKKKEDENVLRIRSKNLGLIKNKIFQITVDKHKKRICLFANNGSGKTLISRCFRLESLSDTDKMSSFHNLINKKETNLEFEFCYRNGNENNSFKIVGNKIGMPKIQNNTGYKFYVFNEDYIDKNIKAKKYQIDSNIEGYIIGEGAIALDTQNTNIEKLINSQNKYLGEFEDEISKTLVGLDKFKISKNTKEYIEISMSNFLKNDRYEKTDNFQLYKQQYEKLKSLPLNISIMSFNNFSFFDIEDLAKDLLKTFDLNDLSENFKELIVPKLDFVEKGLNLSAGSNICPFCGQIYSQDAIKLLDNYTNYIKDECTKAIIKLKNWISKITENLKQYENYSQMCEHIINQFDKYKSFFPSISNLELEKTMEYDEYKILVEKLIELLNQKIENISISIENEDKKKILLFILNNKKIVESNNTKIKKIEKLIDSTNSEKLEINRNLCKAAFNDLVKNNMDKIKDYHEISKKIKNIKSEIEKESEKSKISKKKQVAETMETLLKSFFNDKYIFDKETFKISFLGQDITSDMEFVLSEGERSIIAFCFYIASVYNIVDKMSDLKNVFYIIDDPITSMDFIYVYNIATIINNYCKDLYKTNVLILTHNLEFFNIIIKNGLIDISLMLNNGEIKRISKNLLMPYEYHLRDINDIQMGIKEPDHTTPNSIRHIIESINKFVNPNQNIEQFIIEENIFDQNSPVIKIMQSFSHGEIRLETAYDSETLKKGCACIIDYVKKKFPGQISRIK